MISEISKENPKNIDIIWLNGLIHGSDEKLAVQEIVSRLNLPIEEQKMVKIDRFIYISRSKHSLMLSILY